MVYLTISSAFVLPRHTDDEPEKPKQVDPSLSTEISNGDGAGLGESFAMLGRQITAQRSPRTSLQKAFLKAMEGIENERLVVLLCIVNQVLPTLYCFYPVPHRFVVATSDADANMNHSNLVRENYSSPDLTTPSSPTKKT